MKTNSADTLLFLRAWASNPLRVAAVAPSSDALATLMTCEISDETGPVIELGPGTGSFTRSLLARGVPERDLTLVEVGPDFAHLLSLRFPKASILCIDAAELRRYDYCQTGKAGAVVSGLPLLSMQPRKIMAIVVGAFSQMRGGGALYQFTYGLRCPISPLILDRLGLKATRIGGTFRNVPPAAVYRITRAPISPSTIFSARSRGAARSFIGAITSSR